MDRAVGLEGREEAPGKGKGAEKKSGLAKASEMA